MGAKRIREGDPGCEEDPGHEEGPVPGRGTQRQGASPVRDWGADTVGCQSLHKGKGQVERSKDTIWTEIQPLGTESTGAPALKETKYLSKI